MKTITKFLFALLLLVMGANSIQAQRVYAFDLRHQFVRDNNYPGFETLGTYYFLFKSNGWHPESGDIIFYDSETNKEIGRRALTADELKFGNDNDNTSWDKLVGHTVKIHSSELAQITGNKAYTNMKWGVELEGRPIRDNKTEGATDSLKNYDNYTLASYLTPGGALYQQVREPIVMVLDSLLSSPQDVAVDNNPLSPYFGRVYVANAPSAAGTILKANAHEPGIISYAVYCNNGLYKYVGCTSYVPSGVTLPAEPDENSRYHMHRVAVHPFTGDVYYCKSTSDEFSAIYKAVHSDGNTYISECIEDDGEAFNVTSKLIPEGNPGTSPLHPINSLEFGPDGSLYVLCGAGGNDSTILSGKDTYDNRDDDEYAPGEGKIYKLIDNDNDGIYDEYVQHYTPETETLYDGQSQYGFPYCISPWVHPDNSMAISARGGFWVSQYRPYIYNVEKGEGKLDIFRVPYAFDAYSFLAHIAPKGYEYRKTPGTSLSNHFQYSMGAGAADTYSDWYNTPYWNASQMLAPHQGTRALHEHSRPTGAVAIYEKDGMQGDEALLAVAFSQKVCVFKIFYNEGEDHPDWFGFNMDWMFEIPIPGAYSIDGLAFDYSGNLLVVSSTTHKLYQCVMPDYGPMKDPKVTPVKPMTFKEDGTRETLINGITDCSNNLNRGESINTENKNTTVVSDRLLTLQPVDAAVVFNPTDNNKWSNKNNWNIKRTPSLEDIPVLILGDVTIDGSLEAEASGIIVGNKPSKLPKINITSKGGLTVGKYGIVGAQHGQYSSTINIDNFSVVGDDLNEGAGYLRIHPDVTDQIGVRVNYKTAAQPGDGDNRDRMWQYVGAPGSNTVIDLDSRTWLYNWSESKGWVKADGMEPFKGYAITQTTNVPSYTVAANAIIGDYEDIYLPYTKDGMNIFANSYLAPINVSAFDETDFYGNVERTFYLFNTGSWNDWQSAASVDDNRTAQSPGQYTAIPVLGAGNLDPEADPVLIAPMQGVYVVSGPAGSHGSGIFLRYEKHVWEPKTGNVAMRAPQQSNLLRRIRIQAFGENSGSDRMYIMEDKRCTTGYDNGYDAKNMIAEGQVSIYTNESCGTMEVSSTNDMDGMFIGFQASVDTVYTLRFSSLIGEALYIKDLANGNMIELKDDATYTFTAKAHSVNNMRFQVLVDPFMTGEDTDGNTTDVDNVLSSNTFWMSDNSISVSTNQANSVATIYNVSGQMIMNVPFNNQIEIPTHNFSTGVYILQIKNERYKFIID